MILGGSRKEVIENIKQNINAGNLNAKGNTDDPNLTSEEVSILLTNFYKNQKKISYIFKHWWANYLVNTNGKKVIPDIEIEGLANLDGLDLSHGAIITCNHFSEIDSYNARKLAKILNKDLFIVIEDTNLALSGVNGFLMNYLDTIPLSKSPNYINKTFLPELKKVLDKGNLVLIYPEEEMWFNYKLPRPCKRGAYQFASEFNVPIISLFVELIETDEDDNDEFRLVKYKLHILKPLKVNKKKSIKENSINLCQEDYNNKVKCYEKCYHKKLDYTFSYNDIAGYKYEKK